MRQGWYDSTSYARDEQPRIPRSWTIELWGSDDGRRPLVSLHAFQHRDHSGRWSAAVRISGEYHELGLLPAGATDADAAKSAALDLLRARARAWASAAEQLARAAGAGGEG